MATLTAPSQVNINDLMLPLVIFMVAMVMMKVMVKVISGKKELPPGAGAEARPLEVARTRERARKEKRVERPPAKPYVEENLEEKRRMFEEKGAQIAQQTGTVFVRLGPGWQARYSTVVYWFRDPQGREIVARDVEDLQWKLEALKRTF